MPSIAACADGSRANTPFGPLNVVHEDAHLLVLDKPADLLAVPGRGPDKADCLSARAAVGKEAVDSYYAEESAKILDPVVKFLERQGLKLKTVSKVGQAGETIAKFADSGKFDLLMMGSHGNTAFGNLVMGSVATKVLAGCQVPVLLVR